MRIPECRTSRIGQPYGIVTHGSRAQMGKTIKHIRQTVAEQSRWMEPEESRSSASCQTPPCEDSRKVFDCDAQGR